MKLTNTPSAEVLSVFETVPNMYLILSPDLTILTASNLYLEATLTTREKLVGRHIFEAFPDNPDNPNADGIKNIHASLQRVLTTCKPDQMPVQHYDIPHPTLPGVFVERYWLPSHTPVLSEQGEVSYIIQLATNITDTVLATHQLKASQDREMANLAEIERQRAQLQSIIDHAPIALAFLKGPDHLIESANPLICQMWGRRQAHVLGKSLKEVLAQTFEQGFLEAVEAVFRTGMPFRKTELPALWQQQGIRETKYYNCVCQPLYDAQGVIAGILLAVIDVSEQVLARLKVEQSHQDLRTLHQEIVANNEEIRAANEEVQAVNEQLQGTQQQLRQLNQQLEGLVAERTQALEMALCQTQQLNQQIQEQQDRLQTILALVPASIATLRGPTHRHSFFNASYQSLSGERTQLGRTVAEVYPEWVEQGFIRVLDEVYATGKPFIGIEAPATLYDPTTGRPKQYYIDFTYQPLLDEKGLTQEILIFIVDTTDKVLTRQQVKESEERFAALADNIPNLAWMADREGSIFWYNRRWYDYTGTTPQQMEGWGWQSVHDPQILPEVMDLWTHSLASGQPFEMVFPLKGTDGRFRPFLTRVIPVLDSNRQVQRWFGTNTDIYEQQRTQQQLQSLNEALATTTEELAAANEEIRAAHEEVLASNEELSESNDQLRRTNADLDNFIYTASHDLKAPISNIEALLTALLRTLPPESLTSDKVPDITSRMQVSVDRFKKTIANLTEVVKLQKENSGEAVMVNLAEVIEEVRLDLENQILATQARLAIQVGSCLTIRFSVKNLRSVIYNLLSNALKYRSPERPLQVDIHCNTTRSYHVLTITDNGLGIQAGSLGQLFKMFKRFHDHVEGSGIGLYMVKKMVESAGGKIEVESQLGIGSTFRVYFPP